MTFWNEIRDMMKGRKAPQQSEYRAALAEMFKNRNFNDLSDKEKKEVFEVAAKDFSGKFKEDIVVLANE